MSNANLAFDEKAISNTKYKSNDNCQNRAVLANTKRVIEIGIRRSEGYSDQTVASPTKIIDEESRHQILFFMNLTYNYFKRTFYTFDF
jgi:hypothetical protein